jgi:uncharacterized protein (DUF885 family)
MRWLIAAIGLAGVWGETVHAVPPAAESLHQLFADSWEQDLADDPLFATRYGDRRFNALLPDASLAAQARRLKSRREFLARCDAVARDELSAEDRVNYDVFRRLLVDEIAELEFQTPLMPLTNRSGFHVEFPELPLHSPLRLVSGISGVWNSSSAISSTSSRRKTS